MVKAQVSLTANEAKRLIAKGVALMPATQTAFRNGKIPIKCDYRSKQQEITDRISRLGLADEEYYLSSEYVLQLANRAYDLFLSSEAEEKRQLLKLTLQNLKLDGKKVDSELVRPYKVFARTSRQSWLGKKDSNLR